MMLSPQIGSAPVVSPPVVPSVVVPSPVDGPMSGPVGMSGPVLGLVPVTTPEPVLVSAGSGGAIITSGATTEVAWFYNRSADRFEALEPIRQGARERFGDFAKNVARGLALRHDHGSQYVSHHFQSEIRFLGLKSSPAFVREPEGNGCAERFIRVLKENLLWIRRFDTVEELRLALQAFRQTYNQTWIIERHGYQTPAQVRANQLGRMPMAA